MKRHNRMTRIDFLLAVIAVVGAVVAYCAIFYTLARP